jgi:FxLD family lantipeptide
MITEVDQSDTIEDGFVLDVRLVEAADAGGLVNLTDDGCGSTCGACTTGFC